MPALATTAIVLRSVSYGEADRVVTLFGRTTGRVSAIARGARKSQRRFAGGLGLGSVGEISVRERAGAELLTLESFDVTSSHPSFGTDLARMAHAAYASELVSKLCAPRQVEVGVYDWLATFLGLLDGAGASAERLRVFELGLLGRLGFGPMVGACAVCGGTRTPPGAPAFRWDPDRGGVVCAACGRAGRPLREEVRTALARLAGTPLAEATARALAPDINRGCREAVLEIVKQHISGPLHSLEFIAKLGGPSPMTRSSHAAPALLGIRHVALYMRDLESAERFWVDVMGYEVEWRPDADNVYLRGGSDNLALHRAAAAAEPASGRLDHVGLAVPRPDDVDAWAAHLAAKGVSPTTAPKTHRDGSRSLYFRAPEGLLVQIIHHLPLSQEP